MRSRKDLTGQGLDAGPDTIAWHLEHHHGLSVSLSTTARTLTRQQLAGPEPNKRPKASYIRFAADLPNELWQSDFTHCRLADGEAHKGGTGTDVEIITWIDDHSRYVTGAAAHAAITARIVVDTFAKAAGQHGYPGSTLTENGMVYTVRCTPGSCTAGARCSRTNYAASASTSATPDPANRPPAARSSASNRP